MPNPLKLWGQSRIKADGAILETEGKSQFEPGGVNREGVDADFAAGHFTEKAAPSKLTCSVLLPAGTSVVQLQAIEDATITIEADTGQTYVMSHAWCSNAVSASEGKASCEFMAPPAEEMTL